MKLKCPHCNIEQDVFSTGLVVICDHCHMFFTKNGLWNENYSDLHDSGSNSSGAATVDK